MKEDGHRMGVARIVERKGNSQGSTWKEIGATQSERWGGNCKEGEQELPNRTYSWRNTSFKFAQ